MYLNKSAVMKAAGLGLLISIVMSLLASTLGISTMDTLAADPNTMTAEDLAPLAGPALMMACLGLVLTAAYGALHGWFADREDMPVTYTISHYAMGGALTVVLITLLQTIVGAILVAVGPPPALAESPAAVGLGYLLVMGVSMLVGGILGAIGGAIYGAARQRSYPASPAM